MNEIVCFGAAGEVTGSAHLVKTPSGNILLDCGLFQGRKYESYQRNRLFPFDPKDISAVILSHAHLDHVGRLPLLTKLGFRGPIFSTSATRDLAELILLDTAHIQLQDVEFARRHQLEDLPFRLPLYQPPDIPPVMTHFQLVSYRRDDPNPTEILPGVSARFYDAGHILGSMVTHLRWNDNGQTYTVAYTGDLGRPNMPLLQDPEPIDQSTHTILMESTYGKRLHHPIEEVYATLIQLVHETIKTRGKIIIPAFSLGRTQELIYLLHRLTDEGKIPRLPIVIDSPLASRITDVFIRHQHEYDRQSAVDFPRPGDTPLTFRNLTMTHSVDESKSLNAMPGPMLIISASGMLSGGRVMHHLRAALPDPKNVILITGYQAEHTPGRRLINGATELSIFGQRVKVNAAVRVINDLSAHADANELLAYLGTLKELRRVVLVHAEQDRAADFATLVQHQFPKTDVVIPKASDPILI